MIRVVIDTNVLVSALLQPHSLPATVLMYALSGRVQLCVSDAIFAEYSEVIRRPRLKGSADIIESALQSIRKVSDWVQRTVSVTVCTDTDDNIFIECAEAARADYLITGNQRHFPERWKKTRVIGARELVELLVEQEK